MLHELEIVWENLEIARIICEKEYNQIIHKTLPLAEE